MNNWYGPPLKGLSLCDAVASSLQPYLSGVLMKNCNYIDCCCSVAHSCLTLCASTDCSTQASLSFTISQSLLKLMSVESVMFSNHLILCRPLLLLPTIFPSIRVFSKGSVFQIMWPKYWNFSFSICPSNSGLVSF